jgi:uncharacterized membrane protein YccC
MRRLSATEDMTEDQRRIVFALKIGAAAMISTLLTLVDAVYALSELGAWATITVVIVMQPTLGSTNNKAFQRCLGTVFAAAVAAVVGASARELLPWPVSAVAVGLAVGVVRRLLRTGARVAARPSVAGDGAAQFPLDGAQPQGLELRSLPLLPYL